MKTLPFNFITNRKVKQQQRKNHACTEHIFAIPGQTSLICRKYPSFFLHFWFHDLSSLLEGNKLYIKFCWRIMSNDLFVNHVLKIFSGYFSETQKQIICKK